jgi:hypothetical protein
MMTEASGVTESHPSPHRQQVTLASLWFGLFGAFAAWSIQVPLAYALVSHSCYPARMPLARPLLGMLRPLTIGISLVALGVAIASAAMAYRGWKRTGGEAPGQHLELLEVGEGRSRFMALGGVLTSVLFAVAIILTGAGVIAMSPCSW